MLDFDDTKDWAANWVAFDRFVREWLRIDFLRDSCSAEIDALERSSGISLPPSAREWCSFAFASQTLESFSWRDCLVVEPVPGHEAISLLLQGESDFYWAIETERLAEPDPPVIGYALDYDSEHLAFERVGTWAPKLTAFALDYFLTYLESPGGGFGARQSSEYFDRNQLLADFGPPTCYGHLELFHTDGVLAVLSGASSSWRAGQVNIEIQTKTQFHKLPKSVQRLVKGGYVFHGDSHKYRS